MDEFSFMIYFVAFFPTCTQNKVLLHIEDPQPLEIDREGTISHSLPD